jgi:hypothetical protein
LPQNPSGPNASYIVDFIHNINAAQKVWGYEWNLLRSFIASTRLSRL